MKSGNFKTSLPLESPLKCSKILSQFACTVYIASCFAKHITSVNKLVVSNQWECGIILYVVLVLEAAGSAWEPEYPFSSIFQDDITKTLFLLIIPLLTLNQSLVTRLPNYYMLVHFSVPWLYLILIQLAGQYLDDEKLFARSLVLNILLNAVVSVRTTYYGLTAAVALLFSQFCKNHDCRVRQFIFRLLAIYFINLTLSSVAIYR